MAMTSVDVDPELLREVKEILHVTTTKEAITEALREVAMRHAQRKALDGLAALDLDLNPQKIEYPLD